MNKQEKWKGGRLVGRGIEWCTHTDNPVGGCYHACEWEMPDGQIAICYAKATAESVARTSYPQGFEHHYWRPELIEAWTKYKDTDRRIFVDSMSDLFGHWVPEEQILAVFAGMEVAHWHTFQSLTKNPPRLRMLNGRFPDNLWVGASSPPDFMWGRRMTKTRKEKWLNQTLDTLGSLDAKVRWVSFEPVSWDLAEIVAAHPGAINWAVIGAATNGNRVYQPDPVHIQNLLDVLDAQHVPVFFKGNLSGNLAASPWREFFPHYEPSPYNQAPALVEYRPAVAPTADLTQGRLFE